MVRTIEELSMNAWPAMQSLHYDGWVIRCADGYTKRANSVYPLYASQIDIDKKIGFCESFYRERGLPTVFKLTRASTPANLDAFLEKRGYKETMREWESRLPLAEFDARSFGDWRGRIAHNNIILKSWTGLQDDPEALHKLHALETSLEEDVPTSQESTEVPFETWLKHRTSDNVDFLPDAYYVAIHGDEYVGMSNIWGNQGTKNLYVGLTGVLPQHRRKGIALALKTEVNLWSKAQSYDQIITWNELNNPMFDLNIKLGFIKQPAEIQFMKRLYA